ncbi:hypothetical protein A3A70_02820 [candidate division WWE3 bacterium RIFCSPLOWO2_01_FULL_42_11]|uniref:Uncharacterized protein n=1 Tax=candidate division WWE3 bacterium RIFCSPLOWO2_01_FULL_42_11 TaxID=1802627 RepID=A0A1F4VM21_UNCKA|nr:MAG: hypothetical protein A3A70_02820 [candidate division WWE3 bacterium RIFCSPLOWO2_01_FULL_42_11]
MADSVATWESDKEIVTKPELATPYNLLDPARIERTSLRFSFVVLSTEGIESSVTKLSRYKTPFALSMIKRVDEPVKAEGWASLSLLAKS